MGRVAANCAFCFSLAALALLASCTQPPGLLDQRTAAELLEYIELKKGLLRSVRLEVLRLARSRPELSREEVDSQLKALVRRKAPRFFKQIGAADGPQSFKEELLQRVIEGSVFSLGPAPGPLLTPLVAGTKLYRLDAQSSRA